LPPTTLRIEHAWRPAYTKLNSAFTPIIAAPLTSATTRFVVELVHYAANFGAPAIGLLDSPRVVDWHRPIEATRADAA
jgi:hypothetical protein